MLLQPFFKYIHRRGNVRKMNQGFVVKILITSSGVESAGMMKLPALIEDAAFICVTSEVNCDSDSKRPTETNLFAMVDMDSP